ncbi:restriction endonuclease [Clostridium thermarum]|uniref:restriction endonuclease n=1 Tax=Clostridium thermarum TaxID=1716543 RepID=UPI0013D368E1|nr:restriction endonuclease [Clostridium thermarum]
MDFLEKMFRMIALIAALKIIGKVLLDFKAKTELTNSRNKLNYGLASRKDLSSLSNASFITWSLSILVELGFSNLQVMSYKLSDSYQIKASINGSDAYIKFIKLNLKDTPIDEDDYPTVGRPEVQEFLGTMERDNIKIGYVITNGNFSGDASEFAVTMPTGYYLKLIDGCELTRLHRRNQKQYLVANLD